MPGIWASKGAGVQEGASDHPEACSPCVVAGVAPHLQQAVAPVEAQQCVAQGSPRLCSSHLQVRAFGRKRNDVACAHASCRLQRKRMDVTAPGFRRPAMHHKCCRTMHYLLLRVCCLKPVAEGPGVLDQVGDQVDIVLVKAHISCFCFLYVGGRLPEE